MNVRPVLKPIEAFADFANFEINLVREDVERLTRQFGEQRRALDERRAQLGRYEQAVEHFRRDVAKLDTNVTGIKRMLNGRQRLLLELELQAE